MRTFVAGLVVGAVITAALTLAWDDNERVPRTTTRYDAVIPVETRTQVPPAKPISTRPLPPPGFVVLKIGEGLVFGERPARAADGACDFVCQDIRHGASIHAQHGAGEAAVPLGAVGLPRQAHALAERVTDAPTVLAEHDIWLLPAPSEKRSGIGLVRAADGSVYRLYLKELTPSPDALERSVTVGYKQVPAREGGGVARLPTTRKGPVTTNNDIRRLVAVGASLPGDSLSNQLAGKYVEITGNEPKLDLNRRLYLYEPGVFDRSVRFARGGALFAAQGIAPGGHVILDSYSAVASNGEMAGTIDVKSYGYVHIAGNLTGIVNVKSYATLVIDGDIVGTLNVRSYTKLLLRGRVLGKLHAKGSCWSDFYFEAFHSQSDLERLGADARSVTLHVKESDLPRGKQEKRIGGWRDVIVGGKAWKNIPRR